MPISSHPIAAGPAALPPVAQPAACGPVQGEESPFAKLLSAQPQRPDAAQPADKADKSSDPTDAAPASEPSDETTRPATRGGRTAKPALARGGVVRDPADKVDVVAHGSKEIDTDKSVVDDTIRQQPKTVETETPTTMDPALAQWLASLNRPVAPVAPAAPVVAPGGAPGAVERAVEPSGVALEAIGPGQASQTAAQPLMNSSAGTNQAADMRSPKADEAKALGLELAPAAERISDTASIAVLAERQTPRHDIEPASGVDTHHAIGGVSAAHAASPTQRAEPIAGAVAVAVPTPVTAPEFKGALGMQVSVLARDGIQHAQLHLNPAEMGPISVQIALDGAMARVDFGADSAATRQIIEAGLPELAAALREAGLTLSGGGVSQHSRGQSHDADAKPGERNAAGTFGDSPDTAPPAARRVNLRLPQGAVDLYA